MDAANNAVVPRDSLIFLLCPDPEMLAKSAGCSKRDAGFNEDRWRGADEVTGPGAVGANCTT